MADVPEGFELVEDTPPPMPEGFEAVEPEALPVPEGFELVEPEKGNLDVTQQPVVRNDDGTVSTVRTISIEEDGREVLIPTVSPDGTILPDDKAIELYRRTGKHLGKYNTRDEAAAAALALHESEAKRVRDATPRADRDALDAAFEREQARLQQLAVGGEADPEVLVEERAAEDALTKAREKYDAETERLRAAWAVVKDESLLVDYGDKELSGEEKKAKELERARQIAEALHVPIENVEGNLAEWQRTYALSDNNMVRWREDNPLLAKMLLANPELAPLLSEDKKAGPVFKAMQKVFSWVQKVDAWDKATLERNREMAEAVEASGIRDLPAGEEYQKAKAELDAKQEQLQAEMDATVKEKAEAIDVEAAQAVAPTKSTEQDSPEARRVRSLSGPAYLLAVGQRRVQESVARTKVSMLQFRLMLAENPGLGGGEESDAETILREIHAQQLEATPLALGDNAGLMRDMSVGLESSASTLYAGKESLKAMGLAGGAAFVGGAIIGGAASKSPAGAVEGGLVLARVVAPTAANIGAFKASFEQETAEAYWGLRNEKTDGGQRLTKGEAAGGAMAIGLLNGALEVVGFQAETKGLRAASKSMLRGEVKKALLGDATFRRLATKVGKEVLEGAFVEGGTEVLQDAISQVLTYLEKTAKDTARESLAATIETAKEKGVAFQQGPAYDPQQGLQAFHGGFMGGVMVGGASSISGAAVERLQTAQVESREQVLPILQQVAETAVGRSATQETLQVVNDHLKSVGEAPVRKVYVEPDAVVKYFQKASPEQAEAELSVALGEPGAMAKVKEAQETGQRLVIPADTYVKSFAASEVGKATTKDTSTSPTALTENQRSPEAMRKRDEEAKRIADEEMKAFEQEAFLAKGLAEFERQAAESIVGTLTEDGSRIFRVTPKQALEYARKNAALVRHFMVTRAKEFGKPLAEVFPEFPFVVKVGDNLPESQLPAEALPQDLVAHEAALTDDQRRQQLFVDATTGVNTLQAWEATPRTPGLVTGVIQLPDAVKPINDSTRGGHDVTNRMLTQVAAKLSSLVPDRMVARDGVDFLVEVKDQAELDGLLQQLQAVAPQGTHVTGQVGFTRETARTKASAQVDALRAQGALPAKRGETAFPLESLTEKSFEGPGATRGVPQALAAVEVPRGEAYVRQVLMDPKMSGVRSKAGFEAAGPKRYTVAIDLKGLKHVNDLLSKRHGDVMLQIFAAIAKASGGSAIYLAHLSGDEFAAKHDNLAELQLFLDVLEEELRYVVEAVTVDGVTQWMTPSFRYGVAEGTYGQADQDLNRRKSEEPAAPEGESATDALRRVGVLHADAPRRTGDVGEALRDSARTGPSDEAVAGEEGGAAREGVGRAVGRTPRVPFATESQHTPEAMAEARASVARMRDREKAKRFTAFLDFVEFEDAPRPMGDDALTNQQLNKLAADWGIVDPEYGFTSDESGRTMEEPRGGEKNKRGVHTDRAAKIRAQEQRDRLEFDVHGRIPGKGGSRYRQDPGVIAAMERLHEQRKVEASIYVEERLNAEGREWTRTAYDDGTVGYLSWKEGTDARVDIIHPKADDLPAVSTVGQDSVRQRLAGAAPEVLEAIRQETGAPIRDDGTLSVGELVSGGVKLLQTKNADQWFRKFRKNKHVKAIYSEADLNQLENAVMVTRAIYQKAYDEGFMPEEDERTSPLRTNADFENTYDISTICPRQDQFTATIAGVEKVLSATPTGRQVLPNGILSPEQRYLVGLMMRAEDWQPACWYCYGQAGRDAYDKMVYVARDTAIEAVRLLQEGNGKVPGAVWNELMQPADNQELKPGRHRIHWDPRGRFATFLKNNWEALSKVKLPPANELRDMIRETRATPAELAPLVDTMRRFIQAATKANAPKGWASLRGQILAMRPDKLARLVARAGLRMNSQTDFRPWHIIEMTEAIISMFARGLTAHVYTKETEFLEVFGRTGIKFNLSAFYEHNPDGTIKTDDRGLPVFDDVIGMAGPDIERWIAELPNDAGGMLVAHNDEALFMGLNDGRIHMIIPYHAGPLKAAPDIGEMESARNYESYQHETGWENRSASSISEQMEKEGKSAKEIEAFLKKERLDEWKEQTNVPGVGWVKKGSAVEVTVKGRTVTVWAGAGLDASNHLNDQAFYFALCDKLGLEPKFAGLKMFEGTEREQAVLEKVDGKWKAHPNYMKLIRDVARNPNDQRVPDPKRINHEAGARVATNWVAEKGDKDDAIPEVVDHIVGRILRGDWPSAKVPTEEQAELARKNQDPALEQRMLADERARAQRNAEVLARKKKQQEQGRRLNQMGESGPLWYSAVSKAVEAIGASGTKQMKATSWLNAIKKQGAIKQEELDFLGLKEWLDKQKGSVSAADVKAFVEANQLRVEEKTYEEHPSSLTKRRLGMTTQYQRYTVPGEKKNYRELLFYAPSTPAADYRAPHFGADLSEGLLAHARVDERTLADGRRVLFIEEIQSDLHQKGREQGYEKPGQKLTDVSIDDITREQMLQVLQHNDRNGVYMDANARAAGLQPLSEEDARTMFMQMIEDNFADSSGEELDAFILEALNEGARKGLAAPDAPLKTNWEEFVVKRLVRMAADEGFDTIAWTTGEQQAQRYDLTKKLDRLFYLPTVAIVGFKGGREVLRHDVTSEQALADVVGKSLAKRLLEAPLNENEGAHIIEGDDIKIGGEGMAVAYDQRLPSIVKELVKKDGGRVELGRLQGEAASGVPNLEQSTNELRTALEAAGHVADDTIESLNDGTLQLEDLEDPNIATAVRRYFAAQIGEPFDEASLVGVWTATLPPALLDRAKSEGMPLFQPGEDDRIPQGYTFISEKRAAQAAIGVFLNRNANPSTLAHEVAHGFLEHFLDLSERPDAPQRTKDNAAKMLKALGVTRRGELTRKHHEMFAGSWEAWLMEGKAPKAGLVGVFQAFKLWLMKVYRSVAAIPDAAISPELRDVFSALLATEEEMQAFQRKQGPGTKTAATPQEAEEDLIEMHEATRKAELLALKDRLRVTEKWWKAGLDKLRKQFAHEYEMLPARKAQQHLIDEELVLDRAAVQAIIGNAKVPGLKTAATGGVRPAQVAQLLGFPSATTMLAELAALKPKERWVEERANAAMNEAHPSVLEERTELRRLVEDGLQDYSEKRILDELRITREENETLKMAAAHMVARYKLADLHPANALAAQKKFAQEKAKAAVKGEWGVVHQLAQKELLNLHLFKALVQAQKNVEKLEKLADLLSSKKAQERLGKAVPDGGLTGGPVYQEAVNFLLGAFGFEKKRDDLSMASVGQAINQMNGEAILIGEPDWWADVQSMPQGNLDNLTVSQAAALREALLNLKSAATRKNTSVIEGKRMDRAAMRAEVIAEALANKRAAPPVNSKEWKDRLQRLGSTLTAPLLKIETMMKWLGGDLVGKDYRKSAHYRYVFRVIEGARQREADLQRTIATKVLDAMDAMPAEMKARLGDTFDGRKYFPDFKVEGHQTLEPPSNIHELLAMLLNAGNESSLTKLLNGMNITPEQMVAAFEAELPAGAVEWANTVHEAFESLWPEIQAMEQRVTGVRPPGLVKQRLVLSQGVLKGGYYPAIGRGDVAGVGARQEENAIAALFHPTLGRPATVHGHTKKRTGAVYPIELNLNKVATHLMAHIHDLAFREPIMDVAALVLHPEVQSAWYATLGPERAKQVKAWLHDAARPSNIDGLETAGVVLWAIQKLRGNLSVAVLGYSLPNFMEDMANLPAAAAHPEMSADALAKGTVAFLRNPLAAWRAISEKSAFMRSTDESRTRDLLNGLRSMRLEGLRATRAALRVWEAVKNNAFVPMEVSFRLTAGPTWLARYEKAKSEGVNEKDAVEAADAIVRDLWPQFNPVLQPGLLRNKYLGPFVPFHSFFNTVFNRSADEVMKMLESPGGGAKLRAAMRLGAYTAVLALLASILRGRGPKEGEPPEDWAFFAALNFILAEMPLIGDLGGFATAYHQDRPINARANFVAAAVLALFQAGQAIGDEDMPTATRVKRVGRAAGLLGGVPNVQLERTVGYAEGAAAGDVGTSPVEVFQGLWYGAPREDDPRVLLRMLEWLEE